MISVQKTGFLENTQNQSIFLYMNLCKFWQLYSGVNGDLFQEDLCHTHTQSPVPAADHCRPVPPQETLKHSSVSVSVESLRPGVHKVCLSPPSVSGGNGV